MAVTMSQHTRQVRQHEWTAHQTVEGIAAQATAITTADSSAGSRGREWMSRGLGKWKYHSIAGPAKLFIGRHHTMTSSIAKI